MDLHTAGHRRGVVAAPHHAAVEAGRTTLAEGGNALEAMIAMAATIAAGYPHMTPLGGDGFWLVRERSGRVRALIAAGRAGANARRELYRDYETIPARGALAALTVPAAVAGWMLALEAAGAHGGACGLAIYSRLRSPMRARARSSHRARPASPPRSSPSSRTCPASRRRFCSTASRPRWARRSSRQRSPRRSSISPTPGSTISTAAMSVARLPAISTALAAR